MIYKAVKPMIISIYHITMVLDSVGRVYGCGFNEHGQLGTGNYDDKTRLVPMLGLPVGVTATQIVISDYHTVVLGSNGTVYGCGFNERGQLGTGNYQEQLQLGAMLI